MNYLIGSHGTGKSTLLEELKKVRSDLFITDGVSRPVKKCSERYGLSEEARQDIINELTEWNWINSLKQPKYFCTRSVIDSIIYSEAQGFIELAKKSEEVLKSTDFKKAKFFYIPIEFELENDGIRFTDLSFQKKIDEMILSIFRELEIPMIKLTGSIEERLQKLLKNI